MGMPPSPWYDLSFMLKGEVICGTFMCANWLTSILHHIGTAVHVSTAQAINFALAIKLLGPFASGNSDMESIRICKTIYLPSPFVGIFLEQ